MLTPLRSFTFRHVGSAIGAALAHLSTLPHDSRETLVSKDTQRALFGISWATDIVHETELARELQAARKRRLARTTPGPIVRMAGSSPQSSRALNNSRWIRSVRHVQRSPQTAE